MLSERVQVAAPKMNLDARMIADLLPTVNKSRGNPIDYILDRTLLRPRDAIAYLNECLSKGIGKTRLTWEDIKDAELEYSTKRLLALRDEWKPTFAGIDRVLQEFRRAAEAMSREDLIEILDNVMVLLADREFEGVGWLTTASERMWEPVDAGWFELYEPLISLLYSIGFLGCGIGKSQGEYFQTDHPHFTEAQTNLERVGYYVVHNAYRAALDIHPGPWRETLD